MIMWTLNLGPTRGWIFNILEAAMLMATRTAILVKLEMPSCELLCSLIAKMGFTPSYA